jgi:putative membrane protein
MKKLAIILLAAGISACNRGNDRVNTSGSEADTASIVDTSAITTVSVDTSVSNFIRLTAISNAIEIESAEVAQKKSSNAEVKSFAGMMFADHGNALRKLKTIADKKKVEFPLMVDANRNWSGAEVSGTKTSSDAAEKYGSQSRPGRDITSDDSKGKTGEREPAKSTQPIENSRSNIGGAGADSAMYVSHQDKLNRLKMRTGADFDREYMEMMVADHGKAISLFEQASSNRDDEIQAYAREMLPILKRHETSAKSLLKKLKQAN